jgi:hypothetical protein
MAHPHECLQKDPVAELKETIEEMRRRLGTGDVTLATINLKLEQILAQVLKTNGRVTELERKAALPRMNWPSAGAVVGSVAVICGSLVSLVMMVAK